MILLQEFLVARLAAHIHAEERERIGVDDAMGFGGRQVSHILIRRGNAFAFPNSVAVIRIVLIHAGEGVVSAVLHFDQIMRAFGSFVISAIARVAGFANGGILG